MEIRYSSFFTNPVCCWSRRVCLITRLVCFRLFVIVSRLVDVQARIHRIYIIGLPRGVSMQIHRLDIVIVVVVRLQWWEGVVQCELSLFHRFDISSLLSSQVVIACFVSSFWRLPGLLRMWGLLLFLEFVSCCVVMSRSVRTLVVCGVKSWPYWKSWSSSEDEAFSHSSVGAVVSWLTGRCCRLISRRRSLFSSWSAFW